MPVIPTTQEAEIEESVWAWPRQKLKTFLDKQTKIERTMSVAQVVEQLFSEY
jgi:hypothetical protein